MERCASRQNTQKTQMDLDAFVLFAFLRGYFGLIYERPYEVHGRFPGCCGNPSGHWVAGSEARHGPAAAIFSTPGANATRLAIHHSELGPSRSDFGWSRRAWIRPCL